MNVDTRTTGGGDVGSLCVLLVDPDILEAIAQAETAAQRHPQLNFDAIPESECLQRVRWLRPLLGGIYDLLAVLTLSTGARGGGVATPQQRDEGEWMKQVGFDVTR